MSSNTRVKGQDTFVALIKDGQLATEIDSVKSCDIEFEMDLLEEDYLGEVATRYDSIFKGISVNMEIHMTRQALLELADAIVLRAQRRSGATNRIDVTTSFWLPNGEFPTVVLVDVFFESIPFNTGAREEYITVTLSGKASNYRIIR